MWLDVRLANPPEGLLSKYSKKECEFFYDYASFIHRLVSHSHVRMLLEKLVSMEGIHSNNSIDLRVMIFPARPMNGRPRNTLHGSYNHDSAQISLYPLKLPRDWIRKHGYRLFKIPKDELSLDQRKLVKEIQLCSLTTLIHEVLHVKFGESNLSRYVEEAIVRKLEKKYMKEWESELGLLLFS